MKCMVSVMPRGKSDRPEINTHTDTDISPVSVVWPGGWDQPLVASEVRELGVARELVQVRTGYNIGQQTARSVLAEGTDEAIKREMEEVVEFMISEKTDGMRERCKEVKKMVIEDMESGKSWENMMALGDL